MKNILKLLALALFAQLAGAPPASAQMAAPWSSLPSVDASSGDVSAAVSTATLAAPTSGAWAVLGIQATGNNATAGTTVACTITGLSNGTMTIDVNVGTLTALAPPLNIMFPVPLAATAATAVVFSCPSFGSGNPHAAIDIQAVRVP